MAMFLARGLIVLVTGAVAGPGCRLVASFAQAPGAEAALVDASTRDVFDAVADGVGDGTIDAAAPSDGEAGRDRPSIADARPLTSEVGGDTGPVSPWEIVYRGSPGQPLYDIDGFGDFVVAVGGAGSVVTKPAASTSFVRNAGSASISFRAVVVIDDSRFIAGGGDALSNTQVILQRVSTPGDGVVVSLGRPPVTALWTDGTTLVIADKVVSHRPIADTVETPLGAPQSKFSITALHGNSLAELYAVCGNRELFRLKGNAWLGELGPVDGAFYLAALWQDTTGMLYIGGSSSAFWKRPSGGHWTTLTIQNNANTFQGVHGNNQGAVYGSGVNFTLVRLEPGPVEVIPYPDHANVYEEFSSLWVNDSGDVYIAGRMEGHIYRYRGGAGVP